MVGGALSRLAEGGPRSVDGGEGRSSNRENDAQLVLNVLQAELAAMALGD